ncbi:MAG: hypothetical protein ACKOUM_11845 [Sphingopyxis sp.]
MAKSPNRYRIIERDRRLVVIDDWAGDGGAGSTGSAGEGNGGSTSDATGLTSHIGGALAGPVPHWLARRLLRWQRDGRRLMLATRPLFDNSGPRIIAVGRDDVAQINRVTTMLAVALGIWCVLALTIMPFAVLLAVFALAILANHGPATRSRITTWLDNVEQSRAD